jgi:hypothetical protein
MVMSAQATLPAVVAVVDLMRIHASVVQTAYMKIVAEERLQVMVAVVIALLTVPILLALIWVDLVLY